MSKILLVTGGSRGIGHSVSLGAAQKGWSVCVNFVDNRGRADETVEVIKIVAVRLVLYKQILVKKMMSFDFLIHVRNN